MKQRTGIMTDINTIDAITSDPDTTDRKCPCCGGRGKHLTWQSIDGGSLNSYWREWCEDCEHEDTNDIF
jgi:hypothetical protein